jgi:two-component system phosphate regulon sensor histidine kinase PhoR
MKSIYVRIVWLPVFVYVITGVIFYYNHVKAGSWQAREFLELYSITGLVVLGVSAYLAYRATRQIVEPLRSLLVKLREFPEGSSINLKSSPIPEIEGIRKKSEEYLLRLKSYVGDLNLEKELLRALLNGLQEGVICINRKGIIVFQNHTLSEQLMEKDSTGKPYFKVIKNHYLLEKIHGLVSGNNRITPEPSEFQSHRRHYRLAFQPVEIQNEPVMFLVLVHDITSETNTMRLREDFLQNASHELKTPITSIRGYAETLRVRVQDPNEVRFMEAILRNTERMERIIEDMVIISSIESRAFPFQPVTMKLSDYMEQIRLLVQGNLERKKQTLDINLKLEDCTVYADPLLLEHLLINLVANASRHSPEESTVEIWAEAESATHLLITVADRGPGIPPDLIEKIFERFFRADRNRSRTEGGTGLGLSIVRQITRIHGGKAWVENRPGGGAAFRIRLPIRARALTGEVSGIT